MKSEITINNEYIEWLKDIKEKILRSQLKAAVRLNSELLLLYWELGASIVEKQLKSKWGDGLIKQLSKDLQSEFSNIKGFSETNLKYIRKWYLFYNRENTISQQAVDQLPATKSQQAVDLIIPNQLASISWGQRKIDLTKFQNSQYNKNENKKARLPGLCSSGRTELKIYYNFVFNYRLPSYIFNFLNNHYAKIQ